MARVNGQSIPRSEYLSTLKHAETVFSQKHGQISEKEKKALHQRILDKMIDDELLAQYAAAQGIEVSSDEVTERLKRLKQSGGGEAAFVLFLEETGLEPERVRANLRKNLIIERLTGRLRKGQEVSDRAVAEYYREHKQDFATAQTVELAHILLTGDSGLERARKVRREIQSGLDFAKAAKRYSRDPVTRDQGGALGTLKRGELLPDLEAAAFSLEGDSISTPVKSPAGYHLLKVIGKAGGRPPPLAEVKAQLSELIVESRVKQSLQEILQRLRKTAKTEIVQPLPPD